MSERAPLDVEALRSALSPTWARIDVVEETTSTNTDLVEDGIAPDRSVLAAENQTAGRGRLDRSWVSPPRAGLTFSLLVRPTTPTETWGWLPLMAGVATYAPLAAISGVDPALKWPNDVLAGGQRHKLGGILGQVDGGAAVLGIGLNISTTADELPVPGATSLSLCGAGDTDRAALLVAILTEFDRRYTAWTEAGGDAEASGLAADYRAACATIGQSVKVSTNGNSVAGTASAVDERGRLILEHNGTSQVVAAGDVEHVSGAV